MIAFNCISCIIIILVCEVVSISNSDRIKSKIYENIESNYFCFRRLNATHQIGCNSKEGGNVGIVRVCRNLTDIEGVVHNDDRNTYVPVFPFHFFDLEIMLKLKKSSHLISGVIVYENNTSDTSVDGFSADKSCPNQYFDLYANDSVYGNCAKQPWNEPKSGVQLMFQDFPFPIFFIKNQTSINEILNCYDKFGNNGWPVCAVQMISPMNAAKNSVTCMRRSQIERNSVFAINPPLYCDPLGGTNIFSTLFNTSNNVSISDRSIIVLASRLDSFSMFDNLSPGADSAITSLVTLLSVAHTLHKLKIKPTSNLQNVLFSLFDGEAFDYIGSSKTVYDMKNNKFPTETSAERNVAQIQLHHLSHFIELNQIAFHNTQSIPQLFIHKNINTTDNISQLEEIIVENLVENVKISKLDNGRPLPPSSLQTFLKYDNSITGVVIANHEQNFTNKYYNSLYDDINNVNKSHLNGLKISEHLGNVATVISRTIYQLLTNDSNSNITANTTLIEELIECYLSNSACNLFKYISPISPNHISQIDFLQPYPTYVGVYNLLTPASALRAYTHMLLAYLTGDIINVTKQQCLTSKDEFKYYWIVGETMNGTCLRSQATKTPAISPAFNSDNLEDSLEYSSWTESQWRSSSLRIFVKPSASQEWCTLMFGLFVLCLSFAMVYAIDRKSSILFVSNPSDRQQTLSVAC